MGLILQICSLKITARHVKVLKAFESKQQLGRVVFNYTRSNMERFRLARKRSVHERRGAEVRTTGDRNVQDTRRNKRWT